ncbi:MAG TPA: hypothetical protein VGU66_16115 [Candidatus Elarobacter sp.]|nr:hypothetical protein [Candidatus Elarobacter sp.]
MLARLLLAFVGVLAVVAPAPVRAAKVCAWQIPSEMLSTVFSGNAHSGAPFRFKVADSTALDDGTKVPAGTPGYGIIRAASSAGRHNRDGMLSLEPRYIVLEAANGAERVVPVTMNPLLPVTWTPSEPLLNKAASHVPLPIPGLVMTGVNMVRWGRNITLGPGFKFTVLPVENLARGPVC